MSGALLFLLWRSARGRVVRALRRLREPRYLLGFVIGGGWVLFWTSRFAFGGRGNFQVGMPPEAIEAIAGPLGAGIQLVACAVILIGLGLWWLVPFGKHAIEFSEAELHLLLPAPVSRRQIFQYGILRGQGGVLIGATIVTFFSGVRSPLEAVGRFAGVWVFITIWDLHAKARALWLASLDQMPPAQAWRRRLVVWGAVLAAWTALAMAIGQLATTLLVHAPASFDDLGSSFQTVVPTYLAQAQEGLLGWLLMPLVWLTAPAFVGITGSSTIAAIALSWVAPILYLVAHNEWVVRSQTRFEEAALERARRKSRQADPAARFWKTSDRARTRVPFRLRPRDRPEIAIVWKNLLLAQRRSLRTLALTGGAGVVLTLGVVASGQVPGWIYGVLQITGAVAIVVPPMFAGRAMRNDLRADLLKVETIRPWPIPGTRLVVGELAAPVIMVMLQVALGASLTLGLDILDTFGFAPYDLALKDDVAAFLSIPAGLLVPLILACYLPLALVVATLATALENLAALMFPSWVHLGLDKKQAAAKFGQNMIVFFALSIAMLFGLAPGAVAAGAIIAIQLLWWGIPLSGWELPLLGWVAAAPIGAVIVALIAAAGRLWERLDPSEELLRGGA